MFLAPDYPTHPTRPEVADPWTSASWPVLNRMKSISRKWLKKWGQIARIPPKEHTISNFFAQLFALFSEGGAKIFRISSGEAAGHFFEDRFDISALCRRNLKVRHSLTLSPVSGDRFLYQTCGEVDLRPNQPES